VEGTHVYVRGLTETFDENVALNLKDKVVFEIETEYEGKKFKRQILDVTPPKIFVKDLYVCNFETLEKTASYSYNLVDVELELSGNVVSSILDVKAELRIIFEKCDNLNVWKTVLQDAYEHRDRIERDVGIYELSPEAGKTAKRAWIEIFGPHACTGWASDVVELKVTHAGYKIIDLGIFGMTLGGLLGLSPYDVARKLNEERIGYVPPEELTELEREKYKLAVSVVEELCKFEKIPIPSVEIWEFGPSLCGEYDPAREVIRIARHRLHASLWEFLKTLQHELAHHFDEYLIVKRNIRSSTMNSSH